MRRRCISRRRGLRILARNVRSGGVEIDVIAARGALVVFVEVKTRRSRRAGLPEEAVDARKQARLVAGAAAWLREHPGGAARIRFDVIVCEGEADASACATWRAPSTQTSVNSARLRLAARSTC